MEQEERSDIDEERGDTGGERERARARLRKAGRVALVVVAVVAVAWLGLGLLLHAVTDPDRLARWSERRLESALNREVDVGTVRLGVFPRLEVDLRELRVHNPPGFDASPFAEVGRVRLGVALFPLLRRRVEVDDAGISDAVVRLAVLEDGRSNYGDFVPEGEGEGEPGPDEPTPFRADVGRVELDAASVSYRNEATGLSAGARDVGGVVVLGDPSGEGRPLELRLEAGEVAASGLPGGRSLEPRTAGLDVRGQAGPEVRWLQIREGRVSLGPVEVGLRGRVDSLRSSVRRLDLDLLAESLDLEDLAELAEGLAPASEGPGGRGASGPAPAAWDSLRASGTVALDLEVRGPLGPERRPDVEGLATLRDGRLAARDRPPLADGLSGQVRLAGDSLRVERLRGRLLEGALELSGVVAVDSPRAYRLAVTAAPRLEAWPGVLPGASRERELSGDVRLDLEVRGRPGDPAGVRATGTARPVGVRVRRKGWAGDLSLPGGTLRLTGDGLAASDLPVVAAGDTLLADLEVAGLLSSRARRGAVPSVTAALRGARLDLDALLGRESADSVTYGRLAFARLGAGRVAGRTPEELAAREGLRRPGSLPVRGTVRATLGRVAWGPYVMDDVEVEARLAPDRMEIVRAGLSTFGGRATGTLSLELGDAPLAPFSLELAVEGANAADLLSTLTPLGRLATGTASLSLASSGRLDTLLLPAAGALSGNGRMEATDGQVRENPLTAALASTLSRPGLRAPGYRRWDVPFEVRGDSLVLPPGRLAGGPLPMDFAGRVGFGGSLDLAVTVRLPREAASSLAGRVGGVPSALLERVAGGEGAVPVGLGLRGTLSEPSVRVEIEELRRSLEAAARREAAGELERKAGGLLRSILGGERDTARADTAATPPDTARAPSDTAGAPPDTAGAPG